MNNTNTKTNQTFGETLEHWHLLSQPEKNAALRSMTDNQREVVRFNEQIAAAEWSEQQDELRELGY